MNKFNVGIIGLGVGEQHVEAYALHPMCGYITICDFSRDKAEAVCAKYPAARIAVDADELLSDKDIHIVSIASYDSDHYKQVTKALHNDKHVFVEKPVCLYQKEAAAIKKMLECKPWLRFSSNLILRKSPRFQHLRKMIEDGMLGEVYYAECDYNYGRIDKLTGGWRGDIEFYSVVYGGGVHMVDLLLWLSRDRVIEVMTYGNRIATRGTKFKYRDLCASLLKFKSGMVGKIVSNFGCVSPHFHPVTIYGTKATFINEFEYGRLITSRCREDAETRIEDAYRPAHKGELISQFISSIGDSALAPVPPDDIFDIMSVCFAMERSASKGRPVKVHYV